MSFSPSTDFETIVDGLEAVTLLRRGTESTAVTNALRRAVDHIEIESSDGKYRAGDTRWHLPQSECDVRPEMGDAIEDTEGTHWTVISVQDATLKSRWACVSRDVATSFGLCDLVTIEEQTTTKGTAGALERTWAVWHNVRGRIQIVSAEMGTMDGAQVSKRLYHVFIAEDLEITQNHRLKDEAGNYYRILGYARSETIGELQTIEAEKW